AEVEHRLVEVVTASEVSESLRCKKQKVGAVVFVVESYPSNLTPRTEGCRRPWRTRDYVLAERRVFYALIAKAIAHVASEDPLVAELDVRFKAKLNPYAFNVIDGQRRRSEERRVGKESSSR